MSINNYNFSLWCIEPASPFSTKLQRILICHNNTLSERRTKGIDTIILNHSMLETVLLQQPQVGKQCITKQSKTAASVYIDLLTSNHTKYCLIPSYKVYLQVHGEIPTQTSIRIFRKFLQVLQKMMKHLI